MRRRAWIALGTIAAGLAIITIGLVARTTATEVPGGLLVAAGLVVGLTLLPFWAKTFPPLPPMADLNATPGPGMRWCAGCGRPAPAEKACVSCGNETWRMRRKQRRLHRKQRARPQEKKA